jgi:hypothetical protein
MTEPFITSHAIHRFRALVADVPPGEVRRTLNCRAVLVAIEFGARFVRLAGGQRVVLEGDHIISILHKDVPPGALDPRRDPRFADEGDAHAQG